MRVWEELQQKIADQPHKDRARGELHHGVTIHSVRLPGFFAHQTVIFGGNGETLTLRHDSTDRAAYMPGIFRATLF